MASSPVFTGSPKCGMVQIATANTARDGTGTLGTLYSGGTNGSRIEHIDIQAAGTVTNGVIRLFLYDGTNTRLLYEVIIPATTPSTTLAAYRTSINFSNLYSCLIIPNGYTLKVATNNAEAYNVFAFGGDF